MRVDDVASNACQALPPPPPQRNHAQPCPRGIRLVGIAGIIALNNLKLKAKLESSLTRVGFKC
jgi:hypothetical protein